MVSKFTGKSAKELLAEHADADEIERAAVEAATAARAEREDEDSADTVWVSEEDLERVEDLGNIVVFTGLDDRGRVVRFGADHRPAEGLIEAVRAEGTLPCAVEPWQVLSRTLASVV